MAGSQVSADLEIGTFGSPRKELLRVFVLAMTRDMFLLTRKPELRRQWMNAAVNYIQQHYRTPGEGPEGDDIGGSDTNRVQIDAIVGPDTKGVVFAVSISMRLTLPYIPIHKAGFVSADQNDVVQTTYTNPKNKVNFFL